MRPMCDGCWRAGSRRCRRTHARVLRVVAALPEPTLAAVEAEAAGGLEAALAADVLVREGDRLRFSHPLIAAVVEERTPPADWRALHARLARAAPGQEQRARHLAAAAPGPDEAVAAALEAAAAEAEARAATAAAAELAERAAELTPDTEPDTKLRRLLAAAEAVVVVEDGPRSRRLLEDALARAEPGPARAQVLHKLAWVVADDSAASLSERALEEAGDDDALLADVHLSAALFISMRGEMPRALEHSPGGGQARGGGRRPVHAREGAQRPGVLPALRWRGRPARGADARGRARARRRRAQP